MSVYRNQVHKILCKRGEGRKDLEGIKVQKFFLFFFFILIKYLYSQKKFVPVHINLYNTFFINDISNYTFWKYTLQLSINNSFTIQWDVDYSKFSCSNKSNSGWILLTIIMIFKPAYLIMFTFIFSNEFLLPGTYYLSINVCIWKLFKFLLIVFYRRIYDMHIW